MPTVFTLPMSNSRLSGKGGLAAASVVEPVLRNSFDSTSIVGSINRNMILENPQGRSVRSALSDRPGYDE
jgi:hypothetical protein